MKYNFVNTVHRDADPPGKKGFSDQETLELKQHLGEIEKNIGTKMADQTKQAIEVAMKPVADEVDGLKQFRIDSEAEQKSIKDQLTEISKKGKRFGIEANDADSFKSIFAKELESKQDALKGYGKNRNAISFEMKAVGNIGANGNLSVSGTPAFIHGGALSEPGRKPYEMRHIRDLGLQVRNLPAGMDTYVIRDGGGEGGPTTVAALAAKPQSDRDWVKTVVPITKIAHYYKMPEEYLQDVPWLQAEVTGVGIEELLAVEDSLFLTNAGAGEFKGLNQTFNSTAFAAPASLALAINGANNYDVLVAAWTQLRNLKSSPTAVLLHPSDYALMILAKEATTNAYLFGAPNQTIPNLFGAPIVPHTAVTSDKYFLGDFSKVVVGVRSGLSVRFYDQNEDDAIKNMVTVVIEERVTMAADRSDRIIYGDFSTDAAALETP